MGGAGGSNAYADTATGVAFALTKNRLTFNTHAAEQVAAIVTEAVGGRSRRIWSHEGPPRCRIKEDA